MSELLVASLCHSGRFDPIKEKIVLPDKTALLSGDLPFTQIRQDNFYPGRKVLKPPWAASDEINLVQKPLGVPLQIGS